MIAGKTGTVVCGIVMTLCFTLLSGLATTTRTQASSMSRAQCGEQRGLRDALESLGVRDDMAQGPRWAVANLTPPRIDRIKSYLTTQEAILFQCFSQPRSIADGMADAVNMPDPKPYGKRRVFPLPVRKPNIPTGLRLQSQ